MLQVVEVVLGIQELQTAQEEVVSVVMVVKEPLMERMDQLTLEVVVVVVAKMVLEAMEPTAL
jgi:hypothetical protein